MCADGYSCRSARSVGVAMTASPTHEGWTTRILCGVVCCIRLGKYILSPVTLRESARVRARLAICPYVPPYFRWMTETQTAAAPPRSLDQAEPKPPRSELLSPRVTLYLC